MNQLRIHGKATTNVKHAFSRHADRHKPATRQRHYAGRGYTGHEHFTDFALVNMNARLFDPLVARFLSPDPLIQSPDVPQNANRYTYCFNNPLRYIDPSGLVTYVIFCYDDTYEEICRVRYESEGFNIIICNVSRGKVPYIPASQMHPLDIAQLQRSDRGYISGHLNKDGSINLDAALKLIRTLSEGNGNGSEGAPSKSIKPSKSKVGGVNKSGDAQRKLNIITTMTILTQAYSATVNGATDVAYYLSSSVMPRYAQSIGYADYAKALGTDIATHQTVIKVAGKAASVVGYTISATTAYYEIQNGEYAKATARALVVGLEVGTGFIPVVGPAISLGISVVDAVWGEQLYDWVQGKFDN